MTTERERFESAVFPFVAEIVRLGTGDIASVLSAGSDDRATIVVCENGNVYRVRTTVSIEPVAATQEGEVPS